ncbi:hypothetical protein [Actinoplanes italicus]|uniref:hypothetical protein n=1 Tax=Actinoplanes italicus TaxID=113567 RepID=UPI001940B0C1|nr:hypothetical protein [Actinoplanes italicus]
MEHRRERAAKVDDGRARAADRAFEVRGGAVRSIRVITPGATHTGMPASVPDSCRWKWPHRTACTSLPASAEASCPALRRFTSGISFDDGSAIGG